MRCLSSCFSFSPIQLLLRSLGRLLQMFLDQLPPLLQKGCILCFQQQREGAFGVVSSHCILLSMCLSSAAFLKAEVRCDQPGEVLQRCSPIVLCGNSPLGWGQLMRWRRHERGPGSSSITSDAACQHIAPCSASALVMNKHPHLLYFTWI